jgi:hypothetical protein
MRKILIVSSIILSFLSPVRIIAQPSFGDVFREYSWVPEKMEVLGKNGLNITIPGNIDLAQAVRAEVALEIANEHLGFDNIYFNINVNKTYPVLYPWHEQKYPSPSLWFHHWYPVVPVILSDLKSGYANEIKLQIDTFCFDGKQHPNGKVTAEHPNGEWGLLPPWCPVYAVTLRIYYNPAKKQHVAGNMVSPAVNSVVGLQVPFKISLNKGKTKIKQVDFIGKYEDINYEGDGIYYQWHYHLFKGKIRDHLGSILSADSIFIWNTEWVPDQQLPMEFAAVITDGTGLKYITEPVKGIRLERPGLSVELCKPYEVPCSFTGCQYGTWIFEGPRTEKFYVKGDLSKIIDARYVIASWGDLAGCPGYLVNNVPLTNKPAGDNWFFNLSQPAIEPLSALIYGENTFSTIVHSGRMPDIYLPGIQVLIRYENK